MSRHLTDNEIRDIVNAYCINMIPMCTLAKKYNRTREGIWKVIRKAGINPKGRNTLNDIKNLMVFRDHGDHLIYAGTGETEKK